VIYLELFWAFVQVGLFSIGGGYAALPLIQSRVVDAYGWLNMGEFADIVTISQMTPGPIAINAATFTGTRVAGAAGAVVATLGYVLPSFVIVLIFSILYKKYKSLKYVGGVLSGLRPAVVGLIASAGLAIVVYTLWNGSGVLLSIGSVDFTALGIIAAGILFMRKFRPNPVFVILGAGVIGGIVYSLT
jgi:chromate transporter